MKKPVFSIVIPAYNEELYLGYCLHSLINQNFPKHQYEIIVVDNASTDKTSQIAKNFQVKVLKEPRKGAVFARQKGSLSAKGKIVVSFDADSRAPKNWLNKIEKNFKKNPQAIAVAGFCRLPDYPLVSKIYFDLFLKNFLRISAKVFNYPFHISAANFAFKKEVFLKVGGYPLSGGRPADQALFLNKIKKIGPIIFDPSLTVITSSRRVKGRVLASIITDGLIYTFLDPLFYKLTENHLPGNPPDIRN